MFQSRRRELKVVVPSFHSVVSGLDSLAYSAGYGSGIVHKESAAWWEHRRRARVSAFKAEMESVAPQL